MKPRIAFGRFLIRIGRFIQSLAVTVMRPEELVEVSRQKYARSDTINSWGEKDWLNLGLGTDEVTLLEKIPSKKGRVLILGVGGGREAIQLARLGYEVTGLDFIPEMVEKARENASRRGVNIEGIVQEFSELDVPAEFYNIVWISEVMYSCVPTRKRRVEMLKRIRRALRPGGYFVCQCSWNPNNGTRKGELLRRTFTLLTLGNFWYEKGDALWGNMEFVHTFTSEDEFRSEVKEGGFEVFYFHIPRNRKGWSGRTILRKPLSA